MDGLRQVPCGYFIDMSIMSRPPSGVNPPWGPTVNPKLYKRLNWIMACADIAGGFLYIFDNIRANSSVFFFETTFRYIPERMPWGWRKKSIVAKARQCYFLGKYPNYWNLDNKRIVYAHNLWTPNVHAMTNVAFIPDKFLADSEKALLASLEETFGKSNMDMFLYPDRFPPKDIKAFRENPDPSNPADPSPIAKKISDAMAPLTTFYKQKELNQYLQESDALNYRAKYWAACVMKSYKKPPKPPKSKQMEPEDIKDVTLPTPTAPPSAAPGGPLPSNVSALNMGFSIAQKGNKLELSLDFDFQAF